MGQPEISERLIASILPAHRAYLLAHLDKPVPLRVGGPRNDPDYFNRRAMLAKGLVCRFPANAIRPRATTLTEKGRAVIARVLADAADALVMAGFGDMWPRPIEVLRTIKDRGKSPAATVENFPQTSGRSPQDVV